MTMKLGWLAIATCLIGGAVRSANADSMVKNGPIAASDVKWTPLVPQLGAKGPQMAVVFGDPKAGPVGILLKLPAGFTPGPHTHSSDYTGVVISGELSDAEPGQLGRADKLGPGMQWTEAANHPHDNACSPRGECLEFVYFPKGFDLKPAKK